MFARWGRFVYQRRRVVALLMVAIAAASLSLAARVTDELSSGGWLDATSESAHVDERIANELGGGRSSLILLYRAATDTSELTDARSPDFQERIDTSLAELRSDARVAAVTGYADTGDDRFISLDGHASYVVVQLTLSEEASLEELDELEAKLAEAPGLTTQLTGYAPITRDSNEQSERDLQRAELVSLPLALLILITVFASLLAAGLPLIVAGLAIPTTLAMVTLIASRTEMSIYVLNVSTMLGLALAIDYSLFLVSRFREELHRGRSTAEAVERAVATSGKAVVFSGIAVAIGLLGLLFFEASAMTSIGVGGSLVVLSSVVFALTFLPAALGMLGPRIDALSLGGLLRRLRGRPARGPEEVRSAARREGRWGAVARWVMRHPVLVLLPTLALLLLAGTPFLRLQQGIPDASVFPPGLESRDAAVSLVRDFPPGQTTPIVVLADFEGDPTAPESVASLARYAERLVALEGIDKVETFFTMLRDPATDAPINLSPDELAAFFADPARRAAVQPLVDAYVRGSTVRLDAISPLEAAHPAGTAVIPMVRTLDPGTGITVQVGGAAATGHDFLASMGERMPWAVGMTLVVSAIVLFLLFGSVVIPIKAVLMTLLSISASFGALVWIFQDGNLSSLLDFEPIGFTIAGNPVIMFAVLFGLSMDYEVLMLSRIQESHRRTGDNTTAVAEGLSRTAAVITGAALVMVTVFAAFALAEVITIKSIGVGMAIAVFIDATVIRILLVPATMRLMGRWNWWAPGPLGRLADRLGFSHVETEESSPAAGSAERDPAPA